MDSLEEGHDDEQLPITLQYDFENGFNRVSRARMIEFCEKFSPTLLRYTRLLYDEPATLYCVHGGRVVPCTYADYQSAAGGQLPDRWWRTQQKLS